MAPVEYQAIQHLLSVIHSMEIPDLKKKAMAKEEAVATDSEGLAVTDGVTVGLKADVWQKGCPGDD